MNDLSQFASEALDRIRRRLLDLSRRNPLLNYRERRRDLRIVDELPTQVFKFLMDENEFLLDPIAEDEDEDGTGARQSWELPRQESSENSRHSDDRLQTPYAPEELEKRCRKLAAEARTAIDETGSNFLYLALGFLDWYESEASNDRMRAPLVLVPVELLKGDYDSETDTFSYSIRYLKEDIETNLSLVEKLKQDFGIALPAFDEFGEPEPYFRAIAALMQNTSRWRVAREIVIGLFSFSKILMYRDLDPDRWPKGRSPKDHPIATGVLTGTEPTDEGPRGLDLSEEYVIDSDERCAQIPLVSDADSSQHSALVDALIEGRNLVIQGPPGTGKSQTITNLIAAAMGMGRSVLFVAEKKAALDVVKSRLDRCGLGDFCLELHSHRTNKGQLHTDLARRLQSRWPRPRQVDRAREELEAEKKRLIAFSESARRPLGPSRIPFYEAVWAAGRNRSIAGPEPAVLEPPLGLLARGEIAERAALARQCATMWRELSEECRAGWRGLHIHRAVGPDVRTVVERIQELERETRDLLDLLGRRHMETGLPEVHGLPTVEILGGLSETELRPPTALSAADQLDPLARADQRERLKGAAEALAEAHRLRGPAGPMLESPGAQDAGAARRLAEAIHAVQQLGLGAATLAEVEQRADQVSSCIDAVERLIEARDGTSKLLRRRVDSLDDYRVALVLAELFANVPRSVQNESAAAWMRADIKEIWERAQQNARTIQEGLDQASLVLRDLDVPAADQLETLAAELEAARSMAFRPFRKKWRGVRKSLIPLLRDKRSLKDPGLPGNLQKAAAAIRERNSFADDATFQAALGEPFRGVKTPWSSLEPGVSWIGRLLDTIPDLFVARELVRTWAETRDQANAIAAQVSQVYRALDDYLKDVLDDGWELSVGLLETRLRGLREVCDGSLPLLREAQLRPRATMDETGRATSAQARRLELIEEARGHQELLLQLGVAWHEDETRTGAVLEGTKWVEALAERGVDEALLAWLLCGQYQPRSQELEEIARACRRFLEQRAAVFEVIRRYGFVDEEEWVGSEPTTLLGLGRACEAALRTQSEASAWADWCRLTNQLEDIGLQSLQEAVCALGMEPDCAEALCRALCFEALVREGLRQDPELAGFTRAAHEQTIERFREFDQALKDLLQQQIAANASNRKPPHGINYGRVGDFTELSLIDHEVGKKKRHIPIRLLVRRAASALQSLKPCFLMSPMSVAQYIDPGSLEFDLVVMDEASQLKLEDALGAVIRGRQLVVVGDSKQLPPTSFFDRIGEADVDEDEMAAAEQAESILEIAERVFPRRTLTWHYRSKHEKLISFSNNEFYERRLVVFPSPFGSHPDYGIKRHFIGGGQYSRGRNPLEARRVAEAVREHLLFKSDESLGVATFNAEQRDFVLGELERLRKDDPRFERAMRRQDESEEPFFVKNLENVQGDEREVIFISTTYGPDPSTNRVYQRFGPINRPNGWRRLNVIFTRARKRLELFTCLNSVDVIPEKNQGVTAFHRYLRFAETGIIPDLGSASGRAPDSEFELDVGRLLMSYGYDVQAQIGVDGFFIDLAVRNPQTGTYVLGIECDGATYHSAKSVRDRDRIREDILRQKGWRIHRIWSADWFKNRQVEVERLVAATDSALRASEGRAAT